MNVTLHRHIPLVPPVSPRPRAVGSETADRVGRLRCLSRTGPAASDPWPAPRRDLSSALLHEQPWAEILYDIAHCLSLIIPPWQREQACGLLGDQRERIEHFEHIIYFIAYYLCMNLQYACLHAYICICMLHLLVV